MAKNNTLLNPLTHPNVEREGDIERGGVLYLISDVRDGFLMNQNKGGGGSPYIDKGMALSFLKKLKKEGSKGPSFQEKLTQRFKLLEEAKIKGQTSSRSLSKGCNLLEQIWIKKGTRGPKQPHTRMGIGFVHPSWHSWHAPCLQESKRWYRPEKEAIGQINGRAAILTGRSAKLMAGRWLPRPKSGRWVSRLKP